MKRLANSTPEELSLCPGFGDIKAKRLREAFNQPFRVGETRNIQERGVLPSNLQNSAEGSSSSTSVSREVPNANGSTSTSDEIIGNRRISSLPKGRFATAEEREKEMNDYSSELRKKKEMKEKEKEKESGSNLGEDDLRLEGRSTGKGKGKERQIDEDQVNEYQEEEEEEDYLEDDLTEEEQLKLAMEMSMAEDQ